MPSKGGIEPGFVDDLLSLPTREEQAELLRVGGLLDPEGLDRLLDAADRLLNEDPGKARRLAEACAGLAEDANAPTAAARADYVRAGAHGANGEFDEEIRLTKAAHDGFLALGETYEALRTNAGLMSALLELGRYREALEAGQAVLDVVRGADERGPSLKPKEVSLLAAPVYQNFGAYHELVGQYEQALEAYASSERHYRILGMEERLGEISDNRGIILSHLGRGSEALAAHEAAVDVFGAARLPLSLAKALTNVGETRLRLADYEGSLAAFERADRLLQPLDALSARCSLLHKMADAYLDLNLYAEALSAYRQTDDLLRETGMAHDRALPLWGLGAALIARGELREAEEVLAEAAGLFVAANNLPMLSGVMLEQASLRSVRNDAAAVELAHQALDLVSEDGWPVQQVYARLRLADLLLPDTTAAEPHLLEAERLARPLGLPQLRYRLAERLGRLRLLQGRDEEARTMLEAAVEQIEHLRGTVARETMRASFLQDKTSAYENLLRLHVARDGAGQARVAFHVAERAKSRALVDLLTGVARQGLAPADDREPESRIHGLQADLDATYSRMLGGADDGHGSVLRGLQDRAAGLEAEIARLRLRAGAGPSDPFPFTVAAPADILDEFSPDATVLAYHVVGDGVIAFVVADGDVRVVGGLGTASSSERLLERLDAQWARLSGGQGLAGRHATQLAGSTRRVLAALYEELVAPVEALLERSARATRAKGEVPRLVVVPHGSLHQVPFHALFDGERYLLERFEVSYAPSATVYALCQGRAPRDSGRALVFGVDDPSIPNAAAEARVVARCVPGAEARVGDGATVARLRDEAPGCDVVHLACHGMFRADNPMFSALKLHDRWLTAADAMGLDLAGALVTLSACESGRAGVIGGDEVLGLTRAFIGAGAAALLVSLWLVQDETTAVLMEGWYGRMRRGMGRAAALRAAQLELKEAYEHPYYWAPFVLIGQV